jgi:hypothetical protein
LRWMRLAGETQPSRRVTQVKQLGGERAGQPKKMLDIWECEAATETPVRLTNKAEEEPPLPHLDRALKKIVC